MAEATAVLEHVTSRDGTRIAYRRSGDGPPLVLAHGATSAHWSFRFVDPDRFREVSVPALLLLGEESPGWAGEGTKRIRAALPEARVFVLPGQGHMANVTAPELLADEIARFVL